MHSKQSLLKQFVTLAIPTVLSGWVYYIYTFVDGIFIGRFVGEEALAALNLLVPLLYLPYAFSVMIGVGGSTLVARLLGERRLADARAAFTQALWVIFAIGAVFTVLLYAGAPLLVRWLGAEGTLATLGAGYLRAAAGFTLFSCAGYALQLFLRVEGAARFGLYCLVLGAIVNIGLDYWFIVERGWGMQGAAIATGISQMLSGSLMFGYHLFKARTIVPVRHAFAQSIHAGKIAYNGVSEFLGEVAPSVTIFAFNRVILSTLGQTGLVAYAVLEYLTLGAVITMMSLVQSAQPMISYYRGAGDRQAQQKSFRIGVVALMTFSLLTAVAMVALARPLTQLFLPEGVAAWQVLQGAVFWYALAFIPAGANLAIAGYLTAIEAPAASAVVAMLRSWMLLLGFLWLLVHFWGGDGIWFALLLTELSTLGVSVGLYRHANRQDGSDAMQSSAVL